MPGIRGDVGRDAKRRRHPRLQLAHGRFEGLAEPSQADLGGLLPLDSERRPARRRRIVVQLPVLVVVQRVRQRGRARP